MNAVRLDAINMEDMVGNGDTHGIYKRLASIMGFPKEYVEKYRGSFLRLEWVSTVETAMRNMLEVWVSGSATTYAEGEGKLFAGLDVPKDVAPVLYGRAHEKPLTQEEPNTVVAEYWQNKYDLRGMSGGGYTLLHQNLDMQGANMDIVMYPKIGNAKNVEEWLIPLLRHQETYITDASWRGMARVGWYGKDFFRLAIFDKSGMVTNIMVFPQEFRSKDKWLTMTNWREVQMARLEWEKNGEEWELIAKKDRSLNEEKIKLLGKCERKGELEHHKARIIRAMVMHDAPEDQLDSASFINQDLKVKDEWKYDEWMGVIDNLMPAMMKDPEKTLRLMGKLGIKIVSNENSEWVGQWLREGSQELYENPPDMSGWINRIRQVMPELGKDDVLKLVPEPDKRETVEYITTGDRVSKGGGLDDEVIMDAWKALRMMAWEMSKSDIKEVREDAEKVREGAWKVFIRALYGRWFRSQ